MAQNLFKKTLEGGRMKWRTAWLESWKQSWIYKLFKLITGGNKNYGRKNKNKRYN